MKPVIFLIITLICAIDAYSQSVSQPASVKTNQRQILIYDSARYEIVILGSVYFMKLDRYTGKTSVYTPSRRWYSVEVRGGLPNEAGNVTPKYEIYRDGDHTLLLNNETGQSWFYNAPTRVWDPITD